MVVVNQMNFIRNVNLFLPDKTRLGHIRLLVILLFFSKASTSQVILTAPDSIILYTYEWHLLKMAGTDLEHLDASRIPVLSLSNEHTSFSGSAGCTSFKGEIVIPRKNKIRFTHLLVENRYCKGSNSLGANMLTMLVKTDSYRIRNNELRFYSHGALVGRFYGYLTQTNEYPLACLDGTWITSMLQEDSHGLTSEFSTPVPKLTFSFSEPGTATGITACGSFSIEYNITANKITFSKPVSDQDPNCNDRIEENFISRLLATTQFMLGDDILYFLHGGGVVIGLNRQENTLAKDGPAARILARRVRKTIYACGNE